MWIGDFVRCHSVVQVLRNRFPDRPIDMLATTPCAPLADYMPGVRKAIVADLPRRRLGLTENLKLAARLRAEHYGSALIMSRKWKAALAPFLAGIPERTGFVGEARFVLLNDRRYGERALPRMVDQCAALALPPGAALPASWPPPLLAVPPADIAAWKEKRGLAGAARPIVALAPGAVGPSKRWPAEYYADLTRRLLAEGCAVWVLGGPAEKALAQEIIAETPGAISPASTCATPFWRSRPPRSRYRTIPASSTSPRRSARRRSAFSAQRAPSYGRRSIRSPRSSRPRSRSTAGPATSRSAGSAITAACATYRQATFLPRPSARSPRLPPPGEAGQHNAAFMKSGPQPTRRQDR